MSRLPRLGSCVVLLVGFGLATLMPWVSADARWGQAYFNPKPASDDLILPLPCDGAVALRPIVVVDGGGPLNDRPIDLGSADTDLGYNDFEHHTFLAAPFPGGSGKQVYWMGKYEITRDQYAAVMGHCPQPSIDGRVAQSEVSWLDAMQFAERWTVWLLKNDRQALPKHDQAYAFVRLPTEDEWEYAARGGAAVSDSQFVGRTFPMAEGIDRYAVAGNRSSQGSPQPIGQLLPNPLGLYDVLGNVAEWVRDPYRARHPDRPDGMAGGLVVRGGSYINLPSDLSSSLREEIPPFDARRNAPTRLRFVGLRVVLAAPVGGGLASVERLRKAFLALPRRSGADDRATQKLVEQLKTQAKGYAALRLKLDNLSARLAAEASARADAEREALKAQIQAAAALAYTVCRLGRTINVQETVLKQNTTANGSPEYHLLQQGLATNQADRASSLDAYFTVIRRTASVRNSGDLEAVIQLLGAEYQQRSSTDRRLPFLPIIAAHLQLVGERRPPGPAKLLADIDDLRLCPPPHQTPNP